MILNNVHGILLYIKITVTVKVKGTKQNTNSNQLVMIQNDIY